MSAVGIMACELSAYDFASEQFALEYTEQATTARVVGRKQVQFADTTPGKCTIRNVPQDYATIQDALDAANEGDVSAPEVGVVCWVKEQK